MNHKTCKFLSILLTLVLVIGALPAAVFADDIQDITEVEIDFLEPTAGDNISSFLSSLSSDPNIVPDDAGYEIVDAMIYSDDWSFVEETEFQDKTAYTAYFAVRALDGYRFAYNEYGELEDTYVNGTAWYGFPMDEDDYYHIYFSFAIGLTRIEEVSFDIIQPVVGESPAFEAVVITVPESEGTTAAIQWFESDDDKFGNAIKMQAGELFKAGKYYATSFNVDDITFADGYYLGSMYSRDYVNNDPVCPVDGYTTYYGPLSESGNAVKTPVFDPAGTTFTGTIDVTISCLTEGAEIHYTKDGSLPTAASEVSTGAAITLNETTTLKAIAILGDESSEVAEATYTLRRPSRPADSPADPEPAEPETPEEPKPAENQNFPFTDVAEDAYCRKAVEWALENGITGGTTETTFSPKEPASRAQVMTFLWAASGCPEPTITENPFKDVSEDDYYYKAVLWAYEQGITAGVSTDAFGSEDTVTRGQIVTFLYGVAGRPAAGSESFNDVASGDYYAEAVAWAYENGITSGTGADMFSPDADCLREQIITFLYLYFAE